MAGEGREEAYVLRFVDASLAARVRATLAEEPDADPADALMELDFDGKEKSWKERGRSRMGGTGGRRVEERKKNSLSTSTFFL